jgi:hypothetical protein
MMTSTWRKGMTAAAGGLLLVSSVPADGPGTASIDSVRWIDDWVEVLMSFPDGSPVSGRVLLHVTIEGRRSVVTLPFTTSEAQKVCVRWQAPARLDAAPKAGVIIDDGPPF